MKGRRALLTGLALPLIVAAAFGSASADQPITALAPIETVLDLRNELVGVAVLADGTRYVSDRGAGIVYRVSPSGTVTTAVSSLNRPAGLALDSSGRLLIAEEQAGRVLRLESNGSLTVLAAGIKTPRWLVVNPDGSLYVTAHRLTEPDGTDISEGRDILRLAPSGALSVVATGIRQLQGVVRLNGALIAATKGLESGADSAGMLLRFTVNADGTLAAPTAWVSTGLKQPVGLVLDVLSALYASSKELATDTDTSKRAIGKVHTDLHLSDFASNLTDPQGLALGPDGSLYLADGKGGRLLRFRAPAPPTLTAPTFTRQSLLTVTGTTEAGARVDLFLNDATTPVTVTADTTGAFTAQLMLIVDQANTLDVFATTQGGNGLTSAPLETTIVHDGQAPSLSFQAPPAGAYVRLSVNVQAQASDSGSGVSSLALTVDGTTLNTIVTPSLPSTSATANATRLTTSVPDGTQTLGATATDRAGNSASISRVVIVDNTAPDTQITSGPAGEINVGTATFTFTGTDNLTPVANLQFAWRLNSGAFTAFSAATTAGFSGLAEGTYTFEVKARDLAGNEDPTPATRSFTVRFGPTITSLDPASGSVGTFVTIGGTLFEPGTTTVSFNGLAAVVRTVTATQITTTVPIGATTGAVMVTTSRGNASRTFTVTSTGDFTLTVAPASPAKVRVVAGDQGSARVDVGGSGSFASLVSLGVSTPPSGITASFSPQLVAPGSGSFLTLSVASTASPGTLTLTVTGQAEVDGQSQSRTTTVTVEVLAAATPAVTGRVLTAEAVPKPIPGVTVTLGSAFTLTDAAGNFVLLAPPTGPNMLLVDGRTASTPTAQYPPVEVQITVSASGATRVPFILYLPRLDTANPITLPLNASGATTQEVRATTPLIPGLVVTIPQGTRINGPDGNPVSQITITPVPIDRSPMPFPSGVKPPMLFTIQPGGAVPSQPLPITFPNPTRAAPGTSADLYFFDLIAGTWAVWGQGTVSNDGAAIISNPGFGLPRFAWHFPAPAPFDPNGDEGGPQDAAGGDPVDLVIGRFTIKKADLSIPGRIKLEVQRTYRSENTRVGMLGIGWNLSPYESMIVASGTGLSLVLADRTSYRFVPAGSGRWQNTTDQFLTGAVVTQTAGGFNFDLRFKDGAVHRFAPLQTFTNAAGLSAIIDRNGNTLTITRDTVFGVSDRITRITEPGGRAVTLTYDGQGRLTTVTDPVLRRVLYAYDSQGRLSAVTDAAGGITQYTYDPAHRIIAVTDTRGIVSITNQYDNNGRVIRQTQADGGVWTFNYTVDAGVVTQARSVDPRGNPTTYRFDARGSMLSRTEALGQTTTFAYAPGSNLLIAATDALARTTRFAYDAAGNVTALTDPAGNMRTFVYEPVYSKATRLTDVLGNVTMLEYDAHGNLTAVTDPLGARKTATYDALGQLVASTDALGNRRTFVYDSLGNVIVTTDPLGHTSRRTYDAVSRMTAQTDARGRSTTFAYDTMNRRTQIVDPGGGTTRFTYDTNGNLLTLTDPRGGIVRFTHDPTGRLATRTDAVGGVERFEYDTASNLIRRTDRKGQVSAFTYDGLNRLVGSAHSDATTTSMAYDAVGRIVHASDSVGGIIENHYDVLNRLMTETTALGAVGYKYDALGRRTEMEAPGQPVVRYAYDAASRLTQLQQGAQIVTVEYDALGRRTRLSLPNGVSTQYQYDVASRLTALIFRNASGSIGELTYEYDAAGNRLRVGGSQARTQLPDPVETTTYDNANRQLRFGDRVMTYDANGSVVTMSDLTGLTTLGWDTRNRMVSVAAPSMNATFRYDAYGRRVSRHIGGAATDYLYAGSEIVQEIGGHSRSVLRSLALDEAFALDGTEFHLRDALGSTIGLTDTTGALATTYTYEPFGRTITAGSPSSNVFQFTGREYDISGLYYYRARYFSPELNRFLSEDPLGPATGDNAYAYARNNPITFVDPLGLEAADPATAGDAGTLPDVILTGASAVVGPDPAAAEAARQEQRNRMIGGTGFVAAGVILLEIGGHIVMIGVGTVPVTGPAAAFIIGFGTFIEMSGVATILYGGYIMNTPPPSGTLRGPIDQFYGP